LLANIEDVAIREALADARNLLNTLRGSSISDGLINALDSRLELRQTFLDVADTPQYRNELAKARSPWTHGIPILARLRDTHKLAKAIDESFSEKLQRKLASTMPPRPIVQLSFEDALGHFTRLFKDGEQMIDVLNFHDTQSLQVSCSLSRVTYTC
jgi:N-alpha-acetyltransferase 35, NatC auxiliary subunit